MVKCTHLTMPLGMSHGVCYFATFKSCCRDKETELNGARLFGRAFIFITKEKHEMSDKVSQFLRQFLERLNDKDDVGTNISEEHYRITEGQIAKDLHFFADEIYDGTVEENEYSINVHLKNGQSFRISVEEIKHETV